MSVVPAGLVTKRWTRYGHDRLYVSTADGQRVGWLDLTTGASTIDRPELTRQFADVISAYRSTPPPAAVGAEPASLIPVQPSPPEPNWTDLAANRPGQAVRERAGELLAEMRQRSRIGTFLLRAVDAKTDERAFRVGAEGEEAVGERLDRLTGHGWHVLHSVPVGARGSDIDHVVIGPGGVYTVNTKNHPGGSVWVGERMVLVNGQRTDYLRNSRFEADRARTILGRVTGLDVPVRAVLVVLTGTRVPRVTIKQMPPDVLVLDRTDVPGVFRRAPQRLDAATVETLWSAARRSTT